MTVPRKSGSYCVIRCCSSTMRLNVPELNVSPILILHDSGVYRKPMLLG